MHTPTLTLLKSPIPYFTRTIKLYRNRMHFLGANMGHFENFNAKRTCQFWQRWKCNIIPYCVANCLRCGAPARSLTGKVIFCVRVRRGKHAYRYWIHDMTFTLRFSSSGCRVLFHTTFRSYVKSTLSNSLPTVVHYVHTWPIIFPRMKYSRTSPHDHLHYWALLWNIFQKDWWKNDNLV